MSTVVTALLSVWGLVKTLPSLAGGGWVLIKALPELAKLALEVMKLIHTAANYYERWALVKEFREAVELARTTGDTSEIERIIAGKPKQKKESNGTETSGNSGSTGGTT